MPKLFRQDNPTVASGDSQGPALLSDLKVADSLLSRMKGLLGTASLDPDQGLWIKPCNSVHTFFMNYAIDCVFLDSSMTVCSVIEDLRPGKMVFPQWGASSVIEMKSGRSRQLAIRKGDQLYVGT